MSSQISFLNTTGTGVTFDYQGIQTFLLGIEQTLDQLCSRELRSGDYSIVTYALFFYHTHGNHDTIVGDHLQGGFDMQQPEALTFSLSNLQSRYKNSFQTVIARYETSQPPIDYVMQLFAQSKHVDDKTKTLPRLS